MACGIVSSPPVSDVLVDRQRCPTFRGDSIDTSRVHAVIGVGLCIYDSQKKRQAGWKETVDFHV